MESYFHILGCRLILKDDFWEIWLSKGKIQPCEPYFEYNLLLPDMGDLVTGSCEDSHLSRICLNVCMCLHMSLYQVNGAL